MISSLTPPTHSILFYKNPAEVNPVNEVTGARDYRFLSLQHGEAAKKGLGDPTPRIFLRRVSEREIGDKERLLRKERRLNAKRRDATVICAYPIAPFTAQGEDTCIEVLSLHDYILFTEFTRGNMMLVDATQRAMSNSLGNHGAEILYRYIEQEGEGSISTPLRFRGYLNSMSGLLGEGAIPLTRIIYRKLFQTMRSSIECD